MQTTDENKWNGVMKKKLNNSHDVDDDNVDSSERRTSAHTAKCLAQQKSNK